jgi:hypothetical protein
LKKKHQEVLREKELIAKGKEAVEKQRKLDELGFWEALSKSDDFIDELPRLAEYLFKKTGATGVYIGKLEPKMKPIEEDDDDQAHIDTEAPMVIKFHYANEDHKALMIGKVLEQGQGICHNLFGEGEAEEEEA